MIIQYQEPIKIEEVYVVDRIQQIKAKGFDLTSDGRDQGILSSFAPATTYGSIRVGPKTIPNDAILLMNDYKATGAGKLAQKQHVLRTIYKKDFQELRKISDFYYRTSGIYQRLCRYMAYLYRYDWFLVPTIQEGIGVVKELEELEKLNQKKMVQKFFSALNFLEGMNLKKWCGEVALKVIRHGCYYGYIVASNGKVSIQELPPKYCRSRFTYNDRPAVEFNMRYFDDFFPDTELRQRMLKMFPKDFLKGYKLYQQGKLPGQFRGDSPGWYLLDLRSAIKFNINGEDWPFLISIIPALIDLAQAKEIDKQKIQQKLLKLIIQKLPLDKNNDLVFDVEQARELHNNAVQMLAGAVGINVLTSFADVQIGDLSDRTNNSATDDLERVERSVYNEAGVSQLQFNSNGNIALNNSILNDQATMYNLLSQFESFLNLLLEPYNSSPKKWFFKASFLTTTIYNYKEMSKLYKEQTQMGYSKVLPQVALGQSQQSVLANAYFENDILDLVELFVPPLTSNTMNAEALGLRRQSSRSNERPKSDDSSAGRPQKDDSEKSDKTIKNLESTE